MNRLADLTCGSSRVLAGSLAQWLELAERTVDLARAQALALTTPVPKMS